MTVPVDQLMLFILIGCMEAFGAVQATMVKIMELDGEY
jgi:hypothetical protein